MSQGVMYVEILPSTRGIGKAVEKDATQAFKGAEKTGQGFFNRVGTWAKRGAVAIGGMVAAVGGLALKGGISRALNIEDAQAKLKGLGHDTKSVEAIMNDALASVKGTSFGLDTAATVAATAVAAGIKPGQELEKYLRLTADAATIAGVSMEEMGSILNKATTAGKVYTQELNQLADRGLPIFQWLQDEFGVTAEELRKMVAAGEVDAETFRKVIEENIGGAALASGDTTRGAFANMRAAMGRFGEALVGPEGLGAAKTFFQEVTIIFDGLTDRVAPFVEKFQDKLGEMFQIEGMGDNFLNWLDETIDDIASGPLPQLLDTLAPLLPLIKELASILGEALGDALKELGEALEPVIPMIAEELVDAVVELAPPLTDLLIALLPLVDPLVELLELVAPLAADILDLLVPAVEWLVGAITDSVEMIKEFFGFLTGDQDFEGFLSNMDEIAEAPGTLVRVLLDAIESVRDFFDRVVENLTKAGEFISETLNEIAQFFSDTWEAIGLVTGGALKTIWGIITGDMDLIREGISQGLTAIQDWWTRTWDRISGSLGGVWTRITVSVSQGITRVVGVMRALPGRIMDGVRALPGLLVSVGRDMIQGLINGVRGMIDRAVSAVKDVGGAMLDSVKGFLGIKSPSRVFRDEVGKMVGLGLLEGISDTSIGARLDTAVRHLVEVPDVAAAGRGGAIIQNNNIHTVERDPRLIFRQLGRQLEVGL